MHAHYNIEEVYKKHTLSSRETLEISKILNIPTINLNTTHYANKQTCVVFDNRRSDNDLTIATYIIRNGVISRRERNNIINKWENINSTNQQEFAEIFSAIQVQQNFQMRSNNIMMLFFQDRQIGIVAEEWSDIAMKFYIFEKNTGILSTSTEKKDSDHE